MTRARVYTVLALLAFALMHVLPPEGRTAGHSNLDVIERNWSEYR